VRPCLALGTQGWSYRDWEGGMYARGTPPGAYLREYAREFGSVEVDSTFYGTPAPDRLRRWARAVPAGFTFALKLPREITHERRLRDCARPVAEFFASALTLGPQLEAVLVQLPPDFGPPEWAALEAFVGALPGEVRIALEVRDPRWFAVARRDELLALLRGHGIALAVSDGTFVELDIMLAAFAQPTATFGYVRWLGRRDAVTRFDRVSIDRRGHIARWSAALDAAAARLTRVCGYANNHYMGHGPATIRAIYRALSIDHRPPARCVQTELFPNQLS
jgi:uncharacterized protein YecE (DUF72 family)